MSRRHYVQEIVSETAQAMGLPPLEFDEDACLETEIGDQLVTMMHGTEPAEILWLFVDIAPVPDDPAHLRGLLQLGFVTWASGRMTLGLDDAGQRLIGYTAIPLSVLTADALKERLEQLLATGAEIADRTARSDFETGREPAPEIETASPEIMRP